ncbi:SIMPL domain-containing protein [Chroococcidiopsis sp.]|uniref:SIMPL domain-containing protein n=1 Tax=Chroococcidiopsis sp. TaxID=3088168 RepID=UPI003F3AC72D
MQQFSIHQKKFASKRKAIESSLSGLAILGDQNLKSQIQNSITVTAIALSLSTLSYICPVWAQPAPEKMDRTYKTLTVTGRGVESIPTTLAQVRLGVEVQGKTAQQVQQEAARRSSTVVDLLKSRNVEKLETTGIYLNPLYNYANNEQRLTGYSATNTVSFRVPTSQAGNIIDAAVKTGATRIEGVSFTATDEAIAKARQQALQAATKDAQQQASAVFSSLNFSQKEIVSIQVNSASPPQPPMPLMAREAAFADKAATTPVVGGEQQIEASVTLQIGY